MNDFFSNVDPYGWWLIAALLLAIAELFAPGVFLMWVAIAAGVTGLVSFLLPIDIVQQMILFAVASLVSVYAGRSWYLANPVASEDEMLNDRVARLIGEEVVAVTDFANGRGRVKVGDSAWSARGADARTGARLIITGADGSTLLVEPVADDSALPPPS